ncbi:hypothetical protein F2Q70_00018318 [Brassica cretica]|uniref:Uncharacterized protein n=1 Tax=Brassica cretica TaxID=69181 RepID=A0A3N6RAW7_BRACR|nr:hypothetical protein F2Q70_00018318 [Brassica cretica]KAF2600208.1 hypothetical protein F2Q68_00011581 [Brassica cretica]
MSRGSAAVAKGNKKGVSFSIDCSKPVDDKIMEIASLEKFLQERIKVGGKAGASVILSQSPHNVGDWLRVIAANKDRNLYELRYFNIAENEGEEED